MSSQHHWFHSGNHSLLAHLDVPTQSARSGVVIVPPFGWEDICSYRPLRSLARGLAANGIPTLRYDLPGTGDSSGTALDPNLFAAWIRSVGDAVAELKIAAGVERVSIFGVRLGAMLALAAASAGTQVEGLILWGASATGRTLLRELRAFRNLEITEYAEGEMPPPPPVDGLEVAGFFLSRSTESDLEAFTALNLAPLPNQRVLLLSRDNFPHDNKLVQSLQNSGCQVTLQSGMGYQKMMAEPHEPSSSSSGIEQMIVDFLPKDREDRHLEPVVSGEEKFRNRESCRVGQERFVESVFPQPYDGGSLFSILAQPSAGSPVSDWGLLFMNAGGVRHIGPNRMWVDAARRWAAFGIPSVRFDVERVGESDGDRTASLESLHGDDLVEQLNLMMDAMRGKLGCRRFIAIGLCSGAFAAFQSLIRNPAIRNAVLLNPRLFFWDPAVEPRRLAKRVGAGLSDVSYWRRLARGEFQRHRLMQAARVALNRFLRNRNAPGAPQQLSAEALAHAWQQVRHFETKVTLVFADGEPLLQEMIEEKQMPPLNPLIQLMQVGKTGHTFRAMWAQQLVQDLIDREIGCTVREDLKLELPSSFSEGVSAVA